MMKPTARFPFWIFAACLTLSLAAAPKQPASPPFPVARASRPCMERFRFPPAHPFLIVRRSHGRDARATGSACLLPHSNNPLAIEIEITPAVIQIGCPDPTWHVPESIDAAPATQPADDAT